MVGFDPAADAAIDDFREWRMSARRMGIGHGSPHANQPFLPYTSIEEYFRETSQIERLLRALYPESDATQLPDAGTIKSQAVRVFCILLCIGKGHMIKHFTRHASLNDRHLPFEERPSHFPSTAGEPEFLNEFQECQWEFCAREFEYGEDSEFGSQEILPITYIKQIGGGGSAFVYRIVLHEAYNQLLPDGSNQPHANDEKDHTLVLKTYHTNDAHTYYTNEVSSFKRLRDCRTMIGFFGSFRWNGTCNILLEHADQGTLEDYLARTRSPKSGEDVHTFWTRFLCVVDALTTIHNDGGEDLEGPQILQGWHQDVKPSNILVKSRKGGSRYDVDFKLADLGTSHYKKKVASSIEVTDRDARGTRTYGAPECYRGKILEKGRLQVKRNVDIWSMGCVVSETAVWLVNDYESLKEYRDQRRVATDLIPGFQDGDCFHDGVKVLPTVAEAHDQCLANKRDRDYITAPLLDIVNRFMLVIPKRRFTAQMFCTHADRIIDEAKEKLESHGTTSFFSNERSPVGFTRIVSQKRAQTPPEVPPEFLNSERSTRPHPMLTMTFDPTEHREPNTPGRSPLDGLPTTTSQAFLEDSHLSRRANQHQFGEAGQVQYNPFQRYNEQVLPVPRMQDHPDGGIRPPLINGSRAQRISEPMPYRNHYGATSSSSENYQHRIANSLDNTHVLMGPDLPAKPNFQHPPPGSRTTADTIGDAPTHRGNSHRPRDMGLPSQPEHPPGEVNGFAPVEQQNNDPPPNLSVKEALSWRARVKANKNATLPHGELFQALKGRDSIFLIDDAGSMRDHWDEVKKLLELLAWIAKKHDPNGLEVYFTMSDLNKPKRFFKAKDLVKELAVRRPEGRSDMKSKLGGHLEAYIRKIEQPRPSTGKLWTRSPAKLLPLNIYVFTDGVWQPHCDVESMIRLMVKSLQDHRLLNSQVGVQFIRFGNNVEGGKRLEYLDCGMEPKPEQDIVDMEDSNGNVFKMLLGAINSWFDFSNETAPPPVSIPNMTSNHGNHQN